MDKKIVLSLDGGGIKGLISISILNYIEKRLRQKLFNNDFKIGDVLDFVSGTSTGSIIGSLLIYPDDDGNIKYSAHDILSMYVNLSNNIFERNLKHKFRTLWGLAGPMYSNKQIDKVLSEIYKEIRITDLVKPCLFTSYDIDEKRIVIFTNKDKKQKYKDYLVKDVVRSSTSIPGFFRPSHFFVNDKENTLVDGGVFANNPSLSAFIEVSKTEFDDGVNHYSPNDLLFLSLGTGDTPDKQYSFNKTKSRGIVWWFKPILDILVSSSSELVHYEMYKLFDGYGKIENYHRINPIINNASSSALDSSKENIYDLLLDSYKYIEKNKRYLNSIAEQIIDIKKLRELL